MVGARGDARAGRAALVGIVVRNRRLNRETAALAVREDVFADDRHEAGKTGADGCDVELEDGPECGRGVGPEHVGCAAADEVDHADYTDHDVASAEEEDDD